MYAENISTAFGAQADCEERKNSSPRVLPSAHLHVFASCKPYSFTI